jgi:hypothetical protein
LFGQQAAQEKRVDSERAKATADQQFKLVESEINVQRSVQNAQAARNEGQGERDKLSLISEGQQKQVGALGPEATVKLRQFELTLETIGKFANAHPEVLIAVLANSQKFVPSPSRFGRRRWSDRHADGNPWAIACGHTIRKYRAATRQSGDEAISTAAEPRLRAEVSETGRRLGLAFCMSRSLNL